MSKKESVSEVSWSIAKRPLKRTFVVA